MAKIDPSKLTVDSKSLMRLSVTDRYAMAQSQWGQNYLSSLTPTQYAMMFPPYYREKLAASKNMSMGAPSKSAGYSSPSTSSGPSAYTPPTDTSTPPSSGTPTPKPTTSSEAIPSWQKKIMDIVEKSNLEKKETPQVPSGLKGINKILAEERSRLFKEMDNDPALKSKVLALISREHSPHPEGILERLTNAAAARGKTIKQELYGGFYGPINRGEVPSRLTDKKLLEKFEAAYERVRNGSNDIDLRTDQGMKNEHEFADRNPSIGRKTNIRGEWYSHHGMYGVKWEKKIREKVAHYEKIESEQTSTTTPSDSSETTKSEPMTLPEGLNEGIKKHFNTIKDPKKQQDFIKAIQQIGVDKINQYYMEDESKKTTPVTSTPNTVAIREKTDAILKDPQKIVEDLGKRKDGSVNLGAVDDWLMSRYTKTGWTWKDEKAAKKYNMSMTDYVIRGVDPKIRMELYEQGLKFEKETGNRLSITSAFRDDYRQSLITSGVRAREGFSQHGGSKSRPTNPLAVEQYGPKMAAYGNGGAIDSNMTQWFARNRPAGSALAPTGTRIPNDIVHMSDAFSREAQRLRLSGSAEDKKLLEERYQEWFNKIQSPEIQNEIIKRLEKEGYVVSKTGNLKVDATSESPAPEKSKTDSVQQNVVYIGAGIKKSGNMYDERGILDRESAKEYYRRLGYKDENIRFLSGAGQTEEQRQSIINAVRENPNAKLQFDNFSGSIGSMKKAWNDLSEEERKRVESITMSGGAYKGGLLAKSEDFPGTKFVNRPDTKGHFSHYNDLLKTVEPVKEPTATEPPKEQIPAKYAGGEIQTRGDTAMVVNSKGEPLARINPDKERISLTESGNINVQPEYRTDPKTLEQHNDERQQMADTNIDNKLQDMSNNIMENIKKEIASASTPVSPHNQYWEETMIPHHGMAPESYLGAIRRATKFGSAGEIAPIGMANIRQ